MFFMLYSDIKNLWGAEERKWLQHMVIVGGGPTGVEFGAEMHAFVEQVG